jgi:hypothetical protein
VAPRVPAQPALTSVPRRASGLLSGIAVALRAQAALARAGITSIPKRQAILREQLGGESVDATGLSGGERLWFVFCGFREECDHAGRVVALHPPASLSPPVGPDRVSPSSPSAPERPSRGECLAPGCHREVRQAGHKFCGAPECRSWMAERNRARARERAALRYAHNPKLANQRTLESRRRRRFRIRRETRTRLRRCGGGDHWFDVTDGRRTTCGDPAHALAWKRKRNRRNQARYYHRYLGADPQSSRRRPKRYAPQAKYILTELMA